MDAAAEERFGRWGGARVARLHRTTYLLCHFHLSVPQSADGGVTFQKEKTGEYTPLQTPTAAQNALLSQVGGGSIPFGDFGNKFLISDVNYSNDVLTGTSMEEIAAAVCETTGESRIGLRFPGDQWSAEGADVRIVLTISQCGYLEQALTAAPKS